MNYSFVKCLNPRFVFNKYNGEHVLVECGKCESCLMKKSLARTTRCKLESASNKYTYFVTLTYDNDNLPLAELVKQDIDESAETYDFVEKDGNILGTITFERHIDKMILLKKCKTPNNRLPYLRKTDCQKFIKRLRKFIFKKSHEKIRVYYCGEFGPVHFRPHFHLLLWFNQEQTAKNIQQAVHSCWSFGRVDCQMSSDKSSSYVASYLNSTMYLPRVFKFRQTAPFSHHSVYLGESVFQNLGKEIQENEFERAARKRFFGNGINTDLVLWRSLKARIIPKCKGYSDKSEQERIFTYKLNETIRKWTQEDNPLEQARFITDYVILYDFTCDIPEMEEVFQYFRKNYGYYMYNQNGNIRYFTPYIIDWAKFERSVYVELLLSRKFIREFCDGKVDLLPSRVRILDEFYKYLDYENLKQQLVLEQQLSKTANRHLIKYFFYNSLIVENLKAESVFKNFLSAKKSLYKDFAKHKELNDRNLIFNYM